MSNEPKKSEVPVESGDQASAANSPVAQEASHEHEEDQLDEALEETFPSSDPIAVKITR
jgi:hypothetical protein